MKRSVIVTTLSFLAAAMFFAAPGPASAKDTIHRCTYWSWTGPSSWGAACGTFGITISSPKQDQVVDIGFVATQCTKASSKAKSAEKYFKARRKSLSDMGAKFTKVGKVVKVGKSYRQTSRFQAIQDGKKFVGEFVIGYGFIDATYCNTSQVNLVAPASNFEKSLRKLKAIQKSAKYSGPGDPTP